MPHETDVLVIGGGPAGLASAIACRMRGFRVMLVDAARPPIDKSCGEGLMPHAVTALETLGISLSGRGYPVRGIRFCGSGVEVDASFPEGAGMGLRRTHLHELLCERARAAGVDLRWGMGVQGLSQISAAWVVGADGQQSLVRRWAGLDPCRRDSRRYGFRKHYRIAPWSDCVDIHWGEECQVYATPVAADEVGIALLSRDPKLRLDHALAKFPKLNERLRGVAIASVEKGGVTATRKLGRVTKNNIALVGDASGSVDAVTAEGLSLSFLQALSLAEALARGNLNAYETSHARLMRRPRNMAGLMLLLDRSAWLRTRVLRALAARPVIFSHMVGMHTGSLSPSDFARNALLPLGWRIIADRVPDAP